MTLMCQAVSPWSAWRSKLTWWQDNPIQSPLNLRKIRKWFNPFTPCWWVRSDWIAFSKAVFVHHTALVALDTQQSGTIPVRIHSIMNSAATACTLSRPRFSATSWVRLSESEVLQNDSNVHCISLNFEYHMYILYYTLIYTNASC